MTGSFVHNQWFSASLGSARGSALVRLVGIRRVSLMDPAFYSSTEPCWLSTCLVLSAAISSTETELPSLDVLKVIHQGKCHSQSDLQRARSIGGTSSPSLTTAPHHPAVCCLIKYDQIVCDVHQALTDIVISALLFYFLYWVRENAPLDCLLSWL